MEPLSSWTVKVLILIVYYSYGDCSNDTTNDTLREGRVNGKIEKLPNGNKVQQFVCKDEGFQPDPNDCTVFYRCMKGNNGKLTVFRYQCGPGTIYDPDTEICNHPKSTQRSECRNIILSNNNQNYENEIESIVNSFISKKPHRMVEKSKTTTHTTVTMEALLPTEIDSKVKTPEKLSMTSSTQTPRITRSDDICTTNGFVGDNEDCRKFYRCIGNGRGGFLRYEFYCNELTVWDDDIQSCNHAWAAKKRQCGAKQDTVFPKIDINNEIMSTTLNLIDFGSKLSTLDLQSSTTDKPIFMSKKTTLNNAPINNNYGTESLSNRTNPDNYIQYSEEVPKPLPMKIFKEVSHRVKSKNNSYECTSSGFYGDENDCTKFYRCVENGKGYTKYEYNCGEGTVWDSSIDGCNHAWAVKNCKYTSGNNDKIETTTSNTIISTVSLTQTSIENFDENEDYDVGYGQKPSSTTVTTKITPTTTTTQQTTHVTNKPVDGSKENICRSSGFMGDNVDCQKFYRCVDNGNNGYTKYEFSCGDGTVWDPKIEACNHAWAVEKCGGANSNDNYNKVSSSTTSTTKSETAETDIGYPSNNEIEESTTTKTTLGSSTSSNFPSTSDKCENSGFIGDSKDCKKFYRCVDDGKGGFIQYEFSCGDGTVWDPTIEACNHDWAVEKCGGTNTHDIHKETTVSVVISTTTATPDELDNNEQINETLETTTNKPSVTTITTTSVSSTDDKCESSGFIGDSKDCKKFYRCVDDGRGGFIRYEFSCGEGTVWDPKVEACNHDWAVSKCGNDNEIDKDAPVPSLITTTTPNHLNDDIDNEYLSPDQNNINEAGTTVAYSSTTVISSTAVQSTNKCETSGFMGDTVNCKKFYRCVDDGKGGFIQYEFNCGEGTVWDPSIESCNHESDVMGCNLTSSTDQASPITPDESNELNSSHSTTASTLITPSTENYKNNTPVVTDPNEVCKQEGFVGDKKDCKKFYRCVRDEKGGYTQYEFSCGDGTVWDSEINACNHEHSVKTPCSQSSLTTAIPVNDEMNTDLVSATQSSTTIKQETDQQTSNNNCTSEGIYADSKNCKKFYRCVSNGQSGYIKYEFTCSEGTVWVQEIQACDYDDGSSCSTFLTQDSSEGTSKPTTISQSSDTTKLPQSQTTQTEHDYSSETSSQPSSNSEKCTSEGFYPDRLDCKNFYRCVDNGLGGFTKYDFTCGEGTAWDDQIQSCNHISEVQTCQRSNENNEQTKPVLQDEIGSEAESTNNTQTSSTTGTSSTTDNISSTTGSTKPENPDECAQEGYFGNSEDCKKFFRCVENGKGGYVKYDFTCGDGTIWDQDITACNHPQDVSNPSCKDDKLSSQQPSSTPSSTISTTSTSSSSTASTTQSEEGVSTKPNKDVNCTKAGFYANPNDCKKFYRCVDWEGDGKKFSVFHFDCGDGTIWDPELETCNYENSVYPPRNCNGSQSQSETVTEEPSTSPETQTTDQTTDQSTTQMITDTTTQATTESTTQSTTESTTQSTTESTSQSTTESTTQSTTESTTQSTTESTTQSTTESTTQSTTESTTQSTTESTTQSTTESTTQSTTESTTQSTTESTTQPTTESTTQSTTDSTAQSTTEPSTQSNTESTTQSTTESTTQSTTESTTQPTTESTTQSSTESTTQSTSTTESSTITESNSENQTTTEQPTSTTEQQTESTSSSTGTSSTDETTSGSDGTTTESSQQESTTEGKTDATSTTTESSESTTTTSSSDKCPETDDDQSVFVCPTSFRRHPKYCNMFYQCTEDDNSHEVKIATFNCPNNTIYDESKTQCVEEKKAEKKCEGEIAQKRRFKRLNVDYKEPITVGMEKHACPAPGHYPFERKDGCSPAFLKCLKSDSGKLRGYVYQCPESYVYWSVSRRCERQFKVKDCKGSSNDWSGRWNIPIERVNIAP